jgi:hypothetical protein
MKDGLTQLDRLKNLAKGTAEPKDAEEEYTAFASGRLGTKPQLTLVFRTVAGVSHAFAYAHLYAMEYDPAAGIMLQFSQHWVTVRGRNLEGMFRYLCLHRVQTVQETDALHAEALPAKEAVVTGLLILTARQIHDAK